MTTRISTIDNRLIKLAAVVLIAHLGTNFAHTITHLQIPVLLDPATTGIVMLTHYVLPVIGVVLLWKGVEKAGALIFFLSMAVSLFIQVSLHFVVANPDHVDFIPVGPWQLPFQLSAVGLLVSTVFGVLLGGWFLWKILVCSAHELPKTGRIDGVPDSGFRPMTRVMYWFSRQWFKCTIEPLTVMAHHRNILAGATAFELALVRANQVEKSLKELAMVKAAMMIGCEFCIDFGSAEARELGISDEQLRALTHFEQSNAFSAREKIALRYTSAMTNTPTTVPNELFEDLLSEFTEAELVELTAAIAFENFRGRFNHAFGIDAQGFTEGTYCPRPETSASNQNNSLSGVRS